jgi:hypothetical protein
MGLRYSSVGAGDTVKLEGCMFSLTTGELWSGVEISESGGGGGGGGGIMGDELPSLPLFAFSTTRFPFSAALSGSVGLGDVARFLLIKVLTPYIRGRKIATNKHIEAIPEGLSLP